MARPAAEGTIVIGKIAGVFGLRGEAKVDVFSNDPARFLELQRVWVPASKGALTVLEIEAVRIHKGRALVKFAGFESPEALQPLLGRELRIPAEDRQPLAEGEYYIADLLGLTVRLPDGTVLGQLSAVIETGANDVYEVQASDRSWYLPATAEVVARVDLDARIMDITPLPGLLE